MVSARKRSLVGVIVALTLLFIAGITMGFTFAYFSDTATATNTLNFGKLKISVTDTSSGTAQVALSLSASGSGTTIDGKYWISPDDIITIAGSVGLEQDSVPAYIRMKINLSDASTGADLGAGEFKTAFMEQMSTIVDATGSKQWFVVGSYLYLANQIVASDPFTFGSSNTNTDSTKTTKNSVKVNSNMIKYLQGKSVKVVFEFAAIQASGMGLSSLSGYTKANAESIAGLDVWKESFIEETSSIYTASNTLNSGYVRGDCFFPSVEDVENNHTTASPYYYFTLNSAGDYVAFGFYPQTIKASEVSILDEASGPSEEFNGQNYYKGSDGYLYAKQTATPYTSSIKFSDNTSVVSSTAYYFKLEPIVWKILDVDAQGKALLFSVSQLIAMKYYDDKAGVRTISDGGTSKQVGASNYKYSYIRSYLNGLDMHTSSGTDTTYSANNQKQSFIKCAFTDVQRSKLNDKTISYANATINSVSYSYQSTNDKVFLLSAEDLQNSNYGYLSGLNTTDTNRCKQPTDFAGATGTATRTGGTSFEYASMYWLRTSLIMTSTGGETLSNGYSYSVYGNGLIGNGSANSIYRGVAPAVYITM